MAKVYDFYTMKEIEFHHDEWAEIGVHLEVKIAGGMTVDTAINEMLLEGFNLHKIKSYIKRTGIKDGQRLEEADKLYTREENEFIRRWLRQIPYHPQDRDRKPEDANRVAEIVLFPVRSTLPEWAKVYHGTVVTSRVHQLKVLQERDELLKPSFLFEINWADSGPGVSWPEQYYLTFLPVYYTFVLTMSQQSSEAHGFADLALAAIPPQEGQYLPWKGALAAIEAWWKAQKDDCLQGPWESLWAHGHYNPFELTALRDRLWKGWEY